MRVEVMLAVHYPHAVVWCAQNEPRLRYCIDPPFVTHFNHTCVELVYIGFVYPPQLGLREMGR